MDAGGQRRRGWRGARTFLLLQQLAVNSAQALAEAHHPLGLSRKSISSICHHSIDNP